MTDMDVREHLHRLGRVAGALSAVVSHRSAALHWGWELKTVPANPEVTVRRKRRVTAQQRSPTWSTPDGASSCRCTTT
jgi:hypothetical protein